MKFIGLILAITLTLVGGNAVVEKETTMRTIYRISCGSAEAYTDENENVWAVDQGFSESKTVAREKTLPIHNTAAPEVYRSERYGMESYTLPVKPGTYTIRLHFAETFGCNYQLGTRSFGATVNGKPTVENFDPFTASGGFACPVIIEITGCTARDEIKIEFTKGSAINGIEIVETADGALETVRQITPVATSEATFVGKRQETAPNAKTLKILFIGNSMTFFWAIPESLQAMLETGTRDLRIEPHRSLYGGKDLDYHYKKTDALELIKNGNFDVVVLQEGSTQPLDAPELFFTYAEKFDRAIRDSGARTVLYPSPVHLKHTDADRRKNMLRHIELSQKIGAPIIPVCETLRLCYAERPDVIWHDADTVHMGMYGGYAVACTFYAALTGGADFPPPAILVQQIEIDPDLAVFIQQKSSQAVETLPRASPLFDEKNEAN